MQKSEKISYKVALRHAKGQYKKQKAAAKYAYKLEKSKLKFMLHSEDTAEHPRPSARREREIKTAIRRAKQTYKNLKHEEKLVYLDQKLQAKAKLKKQKKWAKDARLPASLSFSLAAAYVLVFLGLMVLMSVFVLCTVRYSTNKQSETQLSTVYATLQASDFSESAVRSAAVNDIAWVSLHQNGAALYESGEVSLEGVVPSMTEEFENVTEGTVNYRVMRKNIGDRTVYIAKSMQVEDNIFALLLVVMSVAVVIAAIASGVVGISVSQSCLRPVHSMSRLMKEITVGDLSARLDTNRIHTELRDVAHNYNQMMDRLEGSYEAQSRFVSDASHELRTPLSVISGYADILERWGSEDPAVMQEAVSSISAQCSQMNELLSRLLTLSRTEGNLPTPDMKEGEIYPLLQEITRDFSLVAGDRDIMLEAAKSLRAVFDAQLTRQILVIFLDNAVKFTEPHGQITLFAKEAEGGICVGVRDDGVGIAEDKLDKIFDRFYKADPARVEKGYGLGLSIAAMLAEAMDVRLRVTSKVGEGSEFTIEFSK